MDYSTGKEVAKGRKVAVIEDIAASINEFLNLQDEGEADAGFLVCVGLCWLLLLLLSHKSSANNAMWDAAAISVAFTIVNDRIPRARFHPNMTTPYFS